jgi:hypothetical protein
VRSNGWLSSPTQPEWPAGGDAGELAHIRLDVALTAAWFLLVFAIATWVWRRPSGD